MEQGMPADFMSGGPQGSPAQLIKVFGAPILQLLKMIFAGRQGNGEMGNGLTEGADKMDSPMLVSLENT